MSKKNHSAQGNKNTILKYLSKRRSSADFSQNESVSNTQIDLKKKSEKNTAKTSENSIETKNETIEQDQKTRQIAAESSNSDSEIDQENLDFEGSREAENVENLSNQDDEEISKILANSVANTSTNAKKLEKTKNKRKASQELPNSNKSSKYQKYNNLTKPQVALNCDTLAALGRKRKLDSSGCQKPAKKSSNAFKDDKRENEAASFLQKTRQITAENSDSDSENEIETTRNTIDEISIPKGTEG